MSAAWLLYALVIGALLALGAYAACEAKMPTSAEIQRKGMAS
jgi:hypothetical protein